MKWKPVTGSNRCIEGQNLVPKPLGQPAMEPPARIELANVCLQDRCLTNVSLGG